MDWQDRIAVSTTLLQWGTLEEALERLAAAGFRWIEIADDFGDPRRGADAAEAKRILSGLDLRAHALHLPIAKMMIGHPEAGLLREAERVLLDSLDLAAALEAGIAVLHINTDVEELPDPLYAESRAASVELVERLAGRAQELGVTLALENLPIPAGRAGRFGSSLADLCAAFPDPRLGFCLDTGHALVNGCDPAAEARAAGDRLVSIHLSDNDGAGDLHWPPGQGVLDWDGLANALRIQGYEGRVVLEILRNRTGDALDVVLTQMAAFAESA